ncbi:hypothetical protein G6F42_028332 [Rhizopus arrhizus]|nr:hypothetical protein G6F42_028332 [Rhizopus arrhizus]
MQTAYLDEAVLDEESPSTPHYPPTPPPPPPPPQPPTAAPNNMNNEAPFDFGEDFDGILEAIGMRGNVLMLLQNSILMSLMINLCLCVTVWIPYVIGRSVILVIVRLCVLNWQLLTACNRYILLKWPEAPSMYYVGSLIR